MTIIILLFLILAIVGFLIRVCWEKNKTERIRMRVMEYFYQNRKKYDRELWWDVIADYVIETKSDARETFEAFDMEFINSEIGEIALPI